MFDYDAELCRYHPRLLAEAGISTDSRVLDIGCGAGQTTRSAARTARDGDALGLDRSPAMVALARRRTTAEGPSNASYEVGDAQVHPLPARRFTVGLSRFGTMFFAHPVAAFTHVAQALRPGAPFVQLVWQDRSRQEWHAIVRDALADGTGDPEPSGGGAFSLADPTTVEAVLTSAGFDCVRLIEVSEPVYYGPDRESAVRAVASLGSISSALRSRDEAAAARVVDRLRAFIDRLDDDGGVWFDSSAWLVTARRR